MRWYLIDRYLEFVSGDRATAIKNVSLGEEHLHDYFYSHPVMPNSLVLEGMAQTGGLHLGEMTAFESKLVLAKVAKVKYHFTARPGDTLTYRTVIENQSAEGALIVGTSHVGDRLQAESEFYLAALGDKYRDQKLFMPADFLRLLRLLKIYEVGVTADGKPLQMPKRFLDFEEQLKGEKWQTIRT